MAGGGQIGRLYSGEVRINASHDLPFHPSLGPRDLDILGGWLARGFSLPLPSA